MTLHATQPAASIQRWAVLCASIAGRDNTPLARELFTRLERLYATPPRVYHTLDHAHDCIQTFDRFAALAADALLVEWALWLHDVVYVPGKADNEADSAAVSSEFLAALGAPHNATIRADELILATRHTGEPLSGDAALVADVDMAILAAEPAVYARYAAGIRAEYAFAGEDQYRNGRAAFLRSLLARPVIYVTPDMRGVFEAPARDNVRRELLRLGSSR